MDNITENNKLIAEFLVKTEGGLVKLEENIFSTIDEFAIPDDYLTLKDLKYHKNWNLLMEVVEKIESLDHCQIDISLNWCRIGYKGTFFNYDSRDYFKEITKIESVYTACIEFIKWYNEQNKNNESL